MSIFSYNKKKPIETNFRSREEAFSAMLAYLIEERNMEPMEAARQANEFAEIFSVNMGIPTKLEPEKTGIDKYISIAEKIGNYADTHPKAVEVLLGLGTFLAGVFTGKKVESNNTQEAASVTETPKEPIDFDNVK
ncbi:hypothetical protein [uncultured Bacteroides sp.]|uniref:hypothetical protein n=1 Tax=uncultured Bacteroides sp. TaxID=162156 RepID=UPI00261F38FC|nr:hypothetical protein [uncultured Bacteroides sp.]